jgi:hypothetical protein
MDGLPPLCGWEAILETVTQSSGTVFLNRSNIALDQVKSAIAIALRMNKPLIPAGNQGELISQLQYMFEHPYEGDNRNAGPFTYCYSRIADFVIDLVNQGCNPRVMLDYSGTLLWGLQDMGRWDILNNLKRITSEPTYQPYVEWLGSFWSHPHIRTLPASDFMLQIRAWQHHFAAIFGWEALSRVKGFSLPNLQLPNHPDTLFSLISTLRRCGYRWLLVSADHVETLDGEPLRYRHLPHRLVAQNSLGATATIPVLIQSVRDDESRIAHMQPYRDAQDLSQQYLAGVKIPSLIAEIADGETVGSMMNEFPSAFRNTWHDMVIRGGGTRGTVGLNGTEYLELLEAVGCTADTYPTCQAIGQHLIWQRVPADSINPETIEWAIAMLQPHHLEGVEGITPERIPDILAGLQRPKKPLSQAHKLSQLFHHTIAPHLDANADKTAPDQPPLTQQFRYCNALLHTLLMQSRCFGDRTQGVWCDYTQEIYRRGEAILTYDF